MENGNYPKVDHDWILLNCKYLYHPKDTPTEANKNLSFFIQKLFKLFRISSHQQWRRSPAQFISTLRLPPP